MKKLLFVFILLFFSSCNDGDFSVEILDFDDADVQLCGEYVFYKLSSENTESLIIQIASNDEEFLQTEGVAEYNLSSSNRILYRVFDGDAKESFCNEVQPASPKVVEEWEATSGTIEIDTALIEDDNDGIPADEEGYNIDNPENSLDTDGDGLPNYKDIDDDGDNVPTNQEGYSDEETTPSLDTDGDGIPNYLDNDDDGDGINTRLEDENGNSNPTDDIVNGYENPSYLEPDVDTPYDDVENRNHTFNLIYTNTIRIINGFQLQGDGQEIKYDVSGFDYGTYESTTTQTHEF